MREDYDAQARERPHLDADARGDETARVFLCARCRARVLICRRCDRGQVYCAGGCAGEARRTSLRLAGAVYQASRRGRFLHADRSRRWRARTKNVTHQGSPGSADTALLPEGPPGVVVQTLIQKAASGWCWRRGTRGSGRSERRQCGSEAPL